MAKKYYLKSDLDEKFDLIAIHSPVEAFSLAYNLNKILKSNFIKVTNDKITNASDFEFFKWEIKQDNIDCNLISNKKTIKFLDKKSNNSLFFFQETKKVSLVNTAKNVDFFVKVNSGLDVNVVIEKINSLTQVVLAYKIDDKKIKSKFNLIID